MNGQLTFSRRIKEEIALSEHDAREKKAILSGFVRYSGTLSLLPQVGLRFTTSCSPAAKLAFSSIKELYGVQPKLTFTKELRLNKATLYHVEVNEKAAEILEDLEIMKDFSPMVSTNKFLNDTDFHGFLMGCFLASGQISSPAKGHYYCEIVFNEEKEADRVLIKLQSFSGETTMNFKKIVRRGKYVLYLKQSDQISVFLGYIGAVNMMMEYESKRLERDFFNNENRLDICAQANYSKALKKGQQDLEDIATLENMYGEVYFTEKAALLRKLRKENPDASYSELSSLAQRLGVTITKSGVVHIFRKFHLDAEKLKDR